MPKSNAKIRKQFDVRDSARVFLRFALSDTTFLRNIEEFRKVNGIKRVPFLMGSSADEEIIMNAHAAFDDFIKECKMPISSSMQGYLWNYIILGRLGSAPVARYKIINDPIAVLDRETKKPISYARSVSLVTFAKLTPAEEHEAMQDLRERQKWLLHPNALKSAAVVEDLDMDFKIEEAMKAKRRPSVRKEYSGYLKIMSDKLQKGNISQKEFHEAELRNPHGIQKVKDAYTSKDVAREFLGDKKKADAVRQRVRRLKKMRGDFFDHQL